MQLLDASDPEAAENASMALWTVSARACPSTLASAASLAAAATAAAAAAAAFAAHLARAVVAQPEASGNDSPRWRFGAVNEDIECKH